MARQTPIDMQTVEDTSISDLLSHWIAEQQQRDGLGPRVRPRIGILAARGTMRDGGWPAYSGDAPTIHAVLEAGGMPCLVPTLPLIEGYDPLQLLCDDRTFALFFGVLWPVVRELDGLILTGGGDLSSCLYGKPPHPQTETPDAWRDVWERYIAFVPRDEIETLLEEIQCWLRQQDRAFHTAAVPFTLTAEKHHAPLTLQGHVF